METLNHIWSIVAPYLTSSAVLSVIGTIIITIIKSSFTKAINKIDVEKISTEATEKVLAKVKSSANTVSIQPVVESELRKVVEINKDFIVNQLKDTNKNYLNVLDVLNKISAYFDNSFYISDEAKAEVKIAIENAKKGLETAESKEIELVIEENDKVANSPVVVENKYTDR